MSFLKECDFVILYMYILGDDTIHVYVTPLSIMQSSPLPTSTSLHFTPVLDDCNTLDWLSARRLVLLAVHTLYAHQHWEKMIDVATKFDDVTK